MHGLMARMKHYLKESIDSLLIDQLSSFVFGLIVTWVMGNNLQILDENSISIHVRFFLLGVIFLFVYTISVLVQIRPNRYKFRMKSVDILVEYLGDIVNVHTTYKFSTNRFRANRMYTRRSWFSDEEFSLKSDTKGYEIENIGHLGDTFEYYIIFPRFQYFGETKTVDCTFVGTNKKRQFENFYWYDVICPTRSLSIEVHMPQQYCTDSIWLKSFLFHENADGCEKTKVKFNGAYKWKIEPKLGWSYKLEWNWSKSEIEKKAVSNALRSKQVASGE